MEKIKLYTEKIVREAMISAMVNYGMYLEIVQNVNIDKINSKKIDIANKQIKNLTPIEIPSDEEIEERIKNFIRYDDIFFKAGVDWVLEKIKQQANGKQ